MKQVIKKHLRQFLIVLGCAVILRIIIVFIAPIEIQRYFSLGIMIAAIVSFLVWEAIREYKQEE